MAIFVIEPIPLVLCTVIRISETSGSYHHLGSRGDGCSRPEDRSGRVTPLVWGAGFRLAPRPRTKRRLELWTYPRDPSFLRLWCADEERDGAPGRGPFTKVSDTISACREVVASASTEKRRGWLHNIQAPVLTLYAVYAAVEREEAPTSAEN